MKNKPIVAKAISGVLLATFILLQLGGCRTFTKLSVEANRYNLTTEENLEDESYALKIEDFYASGASGTFVGQANIAIHYRFYINDKSTAAVLISSGRTEAAVKYKELIYDLYNNGYSVYIHDHRGQGLSGRMTADPDMGYIDDFQYYVDDMKYFVDQYIKPKGHEKLYLLAHSMGGAIGMTYLEQYPDHFTAAAFSSPMLGLKPPICSLVGSLVGETPKYALGQSEYKDSKSKFKRNTLTGSRIRYDRMIDAFEKEPRARLGGATYSWVYKSCLQFDYMLDNIDQLKTPFVIFSAQNEQIVHAYAHQKFIDLAKEQGKNCLGYEVENAQHELLIEKDEQRIETINKTIDFFREY